MIDGQLGVLKPGFNFPVCQHQPQMPACELSIFGGARHFLSCTLCRQWEGIYVLYTYAAKRQTARRIQQLLANPEAGSENNILRYISFCKY